MLEVRLTADGYLQLAAPIARQYFPDDVLVALVRNGELWLVPLRGAGAGGLLLKQRNPQGDRSVLIWEVLPPDTPSGVFSAYWDENSKALRVVLSERGAET
jgi:hydrogenase maturation protease